MRETDYDGKYRCTACGRQVRGDSPLDMCLTCLRGFSKRVDEPVYRKLERVRIGLSHRVVRPLSEELTMVEVVTTLFNRVMVLEGELRELTSLLASSVKATVPPATPASQGTKNTGGEGP